MDELLYNNVLLKELAFSNGRALHLLLKELAFSNGNAL